ncbi:hypothetical protein ACC734_39140, partial [Rhizobium ruizarguesonis]
GERRRRGEERGEKKEGGRERRERARRRERGEKGGREERRRGGRGRKRREGGDGARGEGTAAAEMMRPASMSISSILPSTRCA